MSSSPSRFASILRGFSQRCPKCREGRLYRKYLKVNERCPACGHELGRYRADDGPAYFTILAAGHLVVGPMLLFPWIWRAPVALVLPATLIPLLVFSLLLLPRIKGALIGLLYSLRIDGEQPPASEFAASE
jgi:uncharacterized protein (DUF983 family)